tara:strand:- start:493 stop:1245 length:753 start_codon:yes stop_codon:yes gene_type:complete
MDKAYWDSLAPSFERNVLEVSERDAAGTLNQTIHSFAGKRKDVIDLGCGAGAMLHVLSKKFRHVSAVDFSSALLDKARQRTPANNINFIQHDLRRPLARSLRADISICVNVLIDPDPRCRESIMNTLSAATKRGGATIIVVPAIESVLHVYRILVDIHTKAGISHARATADANKLFAREVISPVGGVVRVGGTATKHHSSDELLTALRVARFHPIELKKVEYPWSEELDGAPPGLTCARPWDWLAIGEKR